MQKEKRKKTKRLYIRISDDMYDALEEYIKENNISKTELIENFLIEKLGDKIKSFK